MARRSGISVARLFPQRRDHARRSGSRRQQVERLAAAHPRGLVAVVSHADIIKMVVAHFLGMHLDNFQRIVISPASISNLHLGYGRPYVGTVNDCAHVSQMERERQAERKAAQAAEKLPAPRVTYGKH
ncbi:MAG: histidine phosphatase family protein [Anaerolineae bacterium]